MNVACQKPKDFGYSAELWYPALLTRYVNEVAESESYPRMSTASVSTIRKILRKARLNPNKVTYYCEKREPDEEENLDDIVYEVINGKAASSGNQGKRTPAPRKNKSKKEADSVVSDDAIVK